MAKEPGQIAYEKRWDGFGWVLPWDVLPKHVQDRWTSIAVACIVEATHANIALAEQVAFACAALDGADDTRRGLIEENKRLRTALAQAANILEQSVPYISTRRSCQEDRIYALREYISDYRRLAAPVTG